MKNSNRLLKPLMPMLLALAILSVTGCKKFIAVDTPVTSINSQNVYQNDNTAISVLTDIYANISARTTTSTLVDDGITSLSLIPELTADNMRVFVTDATSKLTNYYQNDLHGAGNVITGTAYWDRFYEYIYRLNAAVKGLEASSGLTPAVKQQLLGEAKFLRAFCYFYLVNIYGDVPLILDTDYTVNSAAGRTATAIVYRQVIEDLLSAKSLLNTQYLGANMITATTERIRVNKGAATALLARVYLYTNDFPNAEVQASEVINNNLYSLGTDLNSVFLRNSTETIWSLQPVLLNQNTWEPRVFILPPAGPSAITNPVYLTPDLVSKFTANDKRLQNWISVVTVGGNSYSYAFKYKAGNAVTAVSEYGMVLRLAEQYLIRAEARAQQDKLIGANGAIADLNVIVQRATGLGSSVLPVKADVLDAILLERRKEFFTEWGHRWFDLKRTGKIDAVMQSYAILKGGIWSAYKALYPLSQTQINLSPGLQGQQNPGY